MDDPWGSPWATADLDNKTTSKSKSDLAPPPRALLSGANSPRIPAVVEHAPWGEVDDGFGDWAAAASSSPAQSGWGGGWGPTSPNLSPVVKKDDGSGRSSPIAWPDTIATPKPANGSSVRQPSPDPWANELSIRRRSTDNVSTPRLVFNAASPVDDIQFEPLATNESKPDLGRDGGEPHTKYGTEESRDDDYPGLDGTVETQQDEPSENLDANERDKVDDKPAEQGEDPVAQARESRSSTPSNANTEPDNEHQDSPITSIDEDLNGRQQESNKPSSVVQSLVVKFDGLARAASQESLLVPSTRGKRSPSVGRSEASDDGGDFGEFGDPAEKQEENLATSGFERPPTPQGPEASAEQESTTASSSHQTAGPPTSSLPAAKYRDVSFEVDLNNIDKLFDPQKLDVTAPVIDLSGHVPEQVINDSFTEISERKTWYRISRFGSSRRHNAADDESYRRTTWVTSTVRDDVIRIVRRWMEEDSIAGRVALGGGIAKTQKNMFGWDSSAEPIALEAVFGKKQSHSRSGSLQPLRISALAPPNGDGGLKTSLSLHSPPSQPAAIPAPPIASFGWSSASQTQPSPQEQETIPRSPSPVPTPSSNPLSAVDASVNPQPTSIISTDTVHPPPATKQRPFSQEIEDEDDEWGEMVSSPVESKHPPTTFQSLDDAFGGYSAESQTHPVPRESAPPKAEANNNSAQTDPWAVADFSLFESTPTKPAPSSQSLVSVPNDVFLSAEISVPISMAELRNSWEAALPPAAQTPTQPTPISQTSKASMPSITQSSHEEQDEETANRIIASLPDLSYMLR